MTQTSFSCPGSPTSFKTCGLRRYFPCCWKIHPPSPWKIMQRSEYLLSGLGSQSTTTPSIHHLVTCADRPHITCSFFAEAQRITAEDYVPSMEDIEHASEPAKGVMETHFNHGELSLRVLQVYDQQNWFRKWMPVFKDVTSVMFCVSLADYDEPGISDVGQEVCVHPLR